MIAEKHNCVNGTIHHDWLRRALDWIRLLAQPLHSISVFSAWSILFLLAGLANLLTFPMPSILETLCGIKTDAVLCITVDDGSFSLGVRHLHNSGNYDPFVQYVGAHFSY